MSKNLWRITPVSLVMRAVAPKLEKKIYQKVAPHILPAAAAVGVGVLAVKFAPTIWQTLSPKLAAAGKIIGMGADKAMSIGGKFMQLISQLPQSKQAQAVQQTSPEQIAYMEQTGTVPPELRAMYDQMAQQSYAVPSTGAASLYNPFGAPAEPTVKEAGMFGTMDPMMLAAFGLPVLFYMMSGKK